MKYIRILTVFLMMTLAISPVLAANCAATCASKTVMSTISNGNDADMSTMMHCHKNLTSKTAANNQHHDKSDASHQTCPMGAGCHFAQATPTNTNIKHVLVTASAVSFPSFDSTEKSVDLSPPLKPPA
ncbi:MAG: hypothetical protein H7Z70_01625 [Bacteroidia bacterium]|nr:hypothetical protein [Methylotenera sp.]